MSEKKAAAVLHIRPSDAAIEWLKGQVPKGWREFGDETLSRHLESLARGDHYARISSEGLEGIGFSAVAAVLAAAENAGLERAVELRAQKRQEALLNDYTAEELRAALERAAGGKAPLLSGEVRQAAEDYAALALRDDKEEA